MKKWLSKLWNFIKVKKHWKYILDKEDYVYKDVRLRGIYFENEWVRIAGNKMTVKRGYAWDGCSPKIEFAGIVVGIPDGRFDECKYPSLIHDVFCQFIDTIPVYVTIVVAIFKSMLLDADWEHTSAYVMAVEKFGPQTFLLDKVN